MALAKLSKETYLNRSDFILPIFIVDGFNKEEEISAMPGVFRYSIDRAIKYLEKIKSIAVLLFGVIEDGEKNAAASSAIKENSLVAKAIKRIKKQAPELIIITDVCLCAYTDHGHCGLFDNNSSIDNDETLKVLADMAMVHAQAGADMVAPSAMMDGQVQAIRNELDKQGFGNTAIMSYAAKFSSALYGPFRDAAKSSPQFSDRRAYQIDPANKNEAIRDALLDEKEGADWLMVKPGLPYLDILKELKQKTKLPVASYQVSGEYSMIKLASNHGILDERKTAIEAATAMKRTGADAIITYYAEDLIRWLNL
jgi:porphobilinogen synthase